MWSIIAAILSALTEIIPQLASGCGVTPTPTPAAASEPGGFDPSTPTTNNWALEIACNLTGIPVAQAPPMRLLALSKKEKTTTPATITPAAAAAIAVNPNPIQTVRASRIVRTAIGATALPAGQTYDDVLAFLKMKAMTSATKDMPALFTEAGFTY